jgi:hypothetical protein
VYALPAALKLNASANKALLVAAAGRIFGNAEEAPEDVFEMPFKGWMAGPLRARLLALLNGKNAAVLFHHRYWTR